jgi:gamma-glutamyl-gamma-aminobutyrate hydrolase PuuD
MFYTNGYRMVSNILEADLICFTGGADVTPSYYGEVKEPETICDPLRDAQEANIFLSNPDVPMVGICRGGQFLNVMCGGSIYQHVEKHNLGVEGSHIAINLDGGEEISVSSTHHQMMNPSDDAEILMLSYEDIEEVEACYYEEDNVLCFQPHPEFFVGEHECKTTFFNFIEEYLFNKED